MTGVTTLQAYAVFAGGGVRGAAHCGCLQAAIDQGVNFSGFGGTSAGSIVASLAAAGYTGKQMLELMKSQLKPANLLSDKGRLLQSGSEHIETLLAIVKSKGYDMQKGWSLYRWYKGAKPLVDVLVNNFGLYGGELLEVAINECLNEKLSHGEADRVVTFSDLQGGTMPSLKIVASDIDARRGIVWSMDGHADESVAKAVVASASYPLMFRPVSGNEGKTYSDGGLASNCPSFLFAKEYRTTRYPTIVFDLEPAVEMTGSRQSLLKFGKGLLDTALGASDGLLRSLGDGLFFISVPPMKGVGTLSFDLSDETIDRMYYLGYETTTTALLDNQVLQLGKKAGGKIREQLQLMCGDRKLIEPALRAVVQFVEQETLAKDVRAHVMLPTHRSDGSRIVVYDFGFRPHDGDRDLELGALDGCSGSCIKLRLPQVADLDEARRAFGQWGMTADQQAKIPLDRRSMVSVPIFAVSENERKVQELPIIGVLSLDSSTPLDETAWLTNDQVGESRKVSESILKPVLTWADIIGRLLTH